MTSAQLGREGQTTATDRIGRMQKELFGVFGDREAFAAVRDVEAFDTVVAGDHVTVGIRDPALDVPGRSATATSDEGVCVVWGEAFTPDGVDASSAEWLLERYPDHGRGAVAGLNGSYLAVVGDADGAVVAADPLRSWECFYTDELGPRVFGTDVTTLTGLLDDVTPRRESVLEFLHLGTVLGDRTLFEAVERVPFDGYLHADRVGEYRRFVYDPQPGDHVTELAERLTRAIDRRGDYPGRAGLLLSAGQDSRTILAGRPDIDHCYTIGQADSQEVAVARKLAEQYGSAHTVLQPDDRYLRSDPEKIRYTQGLRESLHVHHAGFDDQLDVDVVYHGLLYDTLFKGYFLERASYGLGDVEIPTARPADDPDPVESLLDTLGFMPEGSRRLAARVDGLFGGLDRETLALDDPRAFLRERLTEELTRCAPRANSVHNKMDLLVLRNQPVMHFRTHLADNYLESFVVSDRDLLQWHLETPPRYRHDSTIDAALAEMDASMLEHRPPARPFRSELLNQAQRFARRKLPFVPAIEPAWPDREGLYDEYDLDDYFFPDHEPVRTLPARQKLRVNDLRWWLS